MGEDRLLRGRHWLCTGAASLCIVSCIVSLFTMAVIAVNRFVYVCWHSAYHVVFTRRHTVAAVVSTWVVGLAVDSPNHVGWSSHRSVMANESVLKIMYQMTQQSYFS